MPVSLDLEDEDGQTFPPLRFPSPACAVPGNYRGRHRPRVQTKAEADEAEGRGLGKH